MIRSIMLCGFACTVNDALGHVEVAHDGTITWDQLQAIKTALWGAEARAIEVFPAQGDVVNCGNYRHLWRLGARDFCPDLLGRGLDHKWGLMTFDGLFSRYRNVWDEAEAVTGQARVWAQSGREFK